jgi:hypothetical protein
VEEIAKQGKKGSDKGKKRGGRSKEEREAKIRRKRKDI